MLSIAKSVHSDMMVNQLLEFGLSGKSVASKEGQLLVRQLKLRLQANNGYAHYIQNELEKLYILKLHKLCEKHECGLQNSDILH